MITFCVIENNEIYRAMKKKNNCMVVLDDRENVYFISRDRKQAT